MEIKAWYARGDPLPRDVVEKSIDYIQVEHDRDRESHRFNGHRDCIATGSEETSYFIEAKTHIGGEITFSHYTHFQRPGRNILHKGIFLYKGSLGEKRGNGGKCGLGGQGGYGGEVVIRNLNGNKKLDLRKINVQGQYGESGQGGLYGKPGKNGWDIGCIDSSAWRHPHILGLNRDIKINIISGDGDSIICPIYNKLYGNGNHDIKFGERKIHHSTVDDNIKNNTKQNRGLQDQAKATRKKTISVSSILTKYDSRFSSIEKNKLQDLQSELENTKQRALELLAENREQQEKQTVELRIKRHVKFNDHKRHNNLAPVPTIYHSKVSRQNVENLIEKLKSDSELETWFRLKSTETDYPQINQLFSTFTIIKDRFQNSRSKAKQFVLSTLKLEDSDSKKHREVEEILIKKYRFAIFEKIANQLSEHKRDNQEDLQSKRKGKNNLYAKIFSETELFKEKQQFDDYLKKKAFLCNIEDSYFDSSHNLNDEPRIISRIAEYFSSQEERKQVEEYLEKIKSEYIGRHGILSSILRRFSNEGKYVSAQELCYLVNAVVTSVLEDREELNIFCWIVIAYPQKKWMNELVLLQLENYYQQPLDKLRESLLKIENKDILMLLYEKLDQPATTERKDISNIENIIYLSSNIGNELVDLNELELSEWPYVLKEKYWICHLSQLTDWQNEMLQEASYYLLSIENIFGTVITEKLLKVLKDKKQELSPDILNDVLSKFHDEKWNLSEEELSALASYRISEWQKKMEQKFIADKEERNLEQLIKLIKVNANTSKEIIANLPQIGESIELSRKNRANKFEEHDIKEWVKKCQRSNEEAFVIEALVVIDRAIELKRGFKLRDTQKLSILALLKNNNNTLAQVSTGEGKSLIVVAASIMKVLYGEKVDIITSSSVLAKRDAEDNKDIYNLFDISVSHNCSEEIEKRKAAYSGGQIVYGDLSNFQRDYLLDRFYGKNILGDRNFENVIVDEVDSMLLDKGNNMLYLSHDLAGLDKLQSVYLYIWQFVSRPAGSQEELAYAFDTKVIKEAVLNDLYGLIKKEDLKKLDSNGEKVNAIWECLVKSETLDNDGKLKESIDYTKLETKLKENGLSNYKDNLFYLLKEQIERDRYIHIPNYLKPFVEYHLESWIDNAKMALLMKERDNYIVDVDRTGTSSDRDPNIIILDMDTGTDQVNSQWDESLHQFLQLKHGCKLSMQSLKAVFTSNVSFLKLYKNLYGLTGTLGSSRERELLKETHGVDFITIPTAKAKLFHEERPVLCNSREEWIEKVYSETVRYTEKRSVLVICETVNEVEVLCRAFKEKGTENVHSYKRDYEKFEIAEGDKKLEQGHIIIATNLAGRGTDIKITEELRRNKGLHVCLTYLPNNSRIEQQAFGRAARSGDEGSGQLILINEKGHEYNDSRVLELKRERDREELYRISNVKVYYENQIKVEEEYFYKFKEQYERLKKDLQVSDEVKEILLQSCLDEWAFWLDKNSVCIKDEKSESDSSLEKFINNLKSDREDCFAWVENHPIQMIKLGKCFAQSAEYDRAIELFDKVIKREQNFSEVAHYYKAFVLGKKNDLKGLKRELKCASTLLEKHSNSCMSASGIIAKIKQDNEESIIQIDAYEKQQERLSNLYHICAQSIDDILGHVVTPESFINNDIKERAADKLHKGLLERGTLKKPKIKRNISEEAVKKISTDYGIASDELSNFLNRFKGKEIDDREFYKALKKDIKLPSREDFWKILIDQGVLGKEVKYITIDEEKLKKIDTSLAEKITLEKQKLEYNSNNEIFLNAELVTQQKDNSLTFEKSSFKKIVNKEEYNLLKKKGVFSFNRKAHINKEKFNSVTFSNYDSVTLKDFAKEGIDEDKAKELLSDLTKKRILKKDSSKNDVYRLAGEINQIDFLSYPVYEYAVKSLLSICFCYRLAFQAIENQFKDQIPDIRLRLMSNLHRSLAYELIEKKVIKLVKVADAQGTKTKVKEILGDELKEDAATNIAMHLQRLQGSLKTVKNHDFLLKSLTESLGEDRKFLNIEEINILSLNGLDSLITIEEKKEKQKCSLKTIFNILAVVILGIVQIVIGAVIEVLSVGAMTHIGGAFISEGIGDLFFAASAMCSGSFSWEEYGKNKLESLMLTVATAGIGAFIARGVKLSRFGHKIAGPKLEVSGKKVAEMSGKKLIKTVGPKPLGKQVVKRIGKKTTEGMAFGLANAGIDTLLENHLQGVLNDIISEMLNIEKNLKWDNVSKSLEEVYKRFGEEKAREITNNLTRNFFEKEDYVEELTIIAGKIASSVTQGITAASKKISKKGGKLGLSVKVIEKTVFWSERAAHLARITTITERFLNSLDNGIKHELIGDHADIEVKYEERERFVKEVIDEWRTLLHDKAQKIMQHHVIGPILKRGANSLNSSIGKKIQRRYQDHKESGYYKNFEKLKHGYQKEIENKKQHSDNQKKVYNPVTRKYHESMMKLLKKTRNPDLFAAIVKQNIPMDMTCVSACTRVIYKMLLENPDIKISGLTIVVQGEGGIRQEFSSGSGKEKIIVNLELKDNHFQLSRDNKLEGKSKSENNCLFDALSEAMPKLRNVRPEDFRNKVAEHIQQDSGIRNHIEQGWHEFPISLDAFGGNKSSDLINRLHLLNIKNIKEIGSSDSEWKSFKNNRIDQPSEYSKIKQKALEKLNPDVRRNLGNNTLTLHHIIPLSTIRDFLTEVAKKENQQYGLEVIRAWSEASGLSPKENFYLHILKIRLLLIRERIQLRKMD